jgi:hypothetical protein
MALNLRERILGRGLAPRPSLIEDFRFEVAALAPYAKYQVAHEEVDVLETPLAVERRYVLTHGSDFLRVDFALCLDGFAAAAELLVQRAAASQREPAADAVIDLSRTNGIGDVGVAWPWGGEERDGVAGFVRHNVMVWMSGRWDSLLEQARALDAALAQRKTGAASGVAFAEPLFTAIAGERTLQVQAGGRIELGMPVRTEARHFFIATGGSVNRDPAQGGWYFRAGLRQGSYSIQAWRVNEGLLPARQNINIKID